MEYIATVMRQIATQASSVMKIANMFMWFGEFTMRPAPIDAVAAGLKIHRKGSIANESGRFRLSEENVFMWIL